MSGGTHSRKIKKSERKTKKAILESPEWVWWQESINSLPKADKRVHYKNRILFALANYSDSGIEFWREQAELWREKYLPKKEEN